MSALGQDFWQIQKQQHLTSSGLSVPFIEVNGPKPTLVMIHGLTDSSRSFSLTAPLLSDHHLLIPDLPGHGGANYTASSLNLTFFAQILLDFILEKASCPIIIVGHSMGALLAMTLAKDMGQEVKGLVVIASSLKPKNITQLGLWSKLSQMIRPLDIEDPFLDEWQHTISPISDSFRSHLRREAAAVLPEVWRKMAQAVSNTDMTELALTLECPTLVITGANDQLFDDSHQRHLVSHMKTSQLIRIENCGHCPHWEQPQLVAQLISNFSNSLPVTKVKTYDLTVQTS